MTPNQKPVTKSELYRLANVSRRKGDKLLRELGLNPIGLVGTSQIYPAETIGKLLAAAAKDNAKPQI